MKKFYFVFLLLILLIPLKTSAIHEVTDARCTASLKTSLKTLANGLNYRLSRNEGNGTITYTGYLLNTDESLLLTDTSDNPYSDIIEGIKQGSKIVINVYASDKTYCNGYKITTLTINAPYYNKYSKDDLCIGNEDYFLCEKYAKIDLSKYEFEKEMKTYSLSKKYEDKVIEPIVEDNHFNIIEFFKNYYLNVIAVVVLLIVFVFLMIINKRNKEKGIL